MAANVHRAAGPGPQPPRTVRVARLAWRGGKATSEDDEVVLEEPLEIRLNGRAVSVTMRTPGDDAALALGFLWGEGIVQRPDDILGVEEASENAVDVQVSAAVLQRGGWQRNFYSTSSCGVCGKASLSQIRAPGGSPAPSEPLPAGDLPAILGPLRAAQAVFERTGGLHAAGRVGADLTLRCIAEDVGRHNAVDKLVGAALLNQEVPLTGEVLAVTGRAGFELVQKAVAAGFAALVAVGAPSSLGIVLAKERGLGLVGFLRENGFNIYASPERFSLRGRPR